MATFNKLSEYRTQVKAALEITKLPVNLQLVDADVDEAIAQAVDEYQSDRPRTRVYAMVGDGVARRLDLSATVTGWSAGFSDLRYMRVRATANTSDEGSELMPEDWVVVEEETAGVVKEILILTSAPGAQETLLLTYSLPHTVDDVGAGTNTIQARDQRAVFALACHYGCIWIAQRAVDVREPSLSADAIDYTAIVDRYADSGQRWRAAYERQVLGEGKEPPAEAVCFPIEDRAFHQERATHGVWPRGV